MNPKEIQLREVGECAVIHVAPSWIYSVKVLAIHANVEYPKDTLYDLEVAWCERSTNSVDLTVLDDPHATPGLKARAGIQMSIRDSWISHVWRAKAYVEKDVNPTGGQTA